MLRKICPFKLLMKIKKDIHRYDSVCILTTLNDRALAGLEEM